MIAARALDSAAARPAASATAALLLLGLAVATPARAADPEAPAAPPDRRTDAGQENGPLPRILERLSRIAWLYADTALRFACDETIVSKPGRTLRYDYIYTVGEDRRLRDYRTQHGGHDAKEIPPDRIPVSPWMSQSYSWIFLFREDRQPLFRFTLEGEDEALGRPAYRVAFEPVFPIDKELSDWFGTLWVDRESSMILRVVAERSLDRMAWRRIDEETLKQLGGQGGDRLHVTTRSYVTEFGVVRNGLRFPSLVSIDVTDHAVPGFRGETQTSRPLRRVEQRYENYRFFNVRTAEEIERQIGGR